MLRQVFDYQSVEYMCRRNAPEHLFYALERLHGTMKLYKKGFTKYRFITIIVCLSMLKGVTCLSSLTLGRNTEKNHKERVDP